MSKNIFTGRYNRYDEEKETPAMVIGAVFALVWMVCWLVSFLVWG